VPEAGRVQRVVHRREAAAELVRLQHRRIVEVGEPHGRAVHRVDLHRDDPEARLEVADQHRVVARRVLGHRRREAELLRERDHTVQQLGVQAAAAVVRVHRHVVELERLREALARGEHARERAVAGAHEPVVGEAVGVL